MSPEFVEPIRKQKKVQLFVKLSPSSASAANAVAVESAPVDEVQVQNRVAYVPNSNQLDNTEAVAIDR